MLQDDAMGILIYDLVSRIYQQFVNQVRKCTTATSKPIGNVLFNKNSKTGNELFIRLTKMR